MCSKRSELTRETESTPVPPQPPPPPPHAPDVEVAPTAGDLRPTVSWGGGGAGTCFNFHSDGGGTPPPWTPSPPPLDPLPPSPPPPSAQVQLKTWGLGTFFGDVGKNFSAPSAHATHCLLIILCVLCVPCRGGWRPNPRSRPSPRGLLSSDSDAPILNELGELLVVWRLAPWPTPPSLPLPPPVGSRVTFPLRGHQHKT